MTDSKDTTAMLAHKSVVSAITGALVRRKRRARHLADDVPEVQLRCLKAARRGPMPKDVGEWCALGVTVARRYAKRQRQRERTRALHDDGPYDDEKAYVRAEWEHGRDPVDTERYIAVLKGLFRSGQMPEMGMEILWAVAESVTQTEIAQETGLTGNQVEYRLRCMRVAFQERLDELGMNDRGANDAGGTVSHLFQKSVPANRGDCH
jgi:hypothetical protein